MDGRAAAYTCPIHIREGTIEKMLTREKDDLKPLRQRAHLVSLENRERASFTGVTDVESFNEEEVVLLTEQGAAMLSGEELHISRLDLEDGQLVVEGRVLAVEYIDSPRPAKKGLFGRMFGK